jgi:hypothetical protein
MVVDGNVVLDGQLTVDPIGGFVPALGNTFDIISAPSITGSFDVIDFSGVPAGLSLSVNYMPTLVQLVVVGALPGDYNRNGVVDAADYVLWRDTLGNPVTPSSGADGNGNGTVDNGDYDVWRANFGFTVGNGGSAGIGAGVPEPASWLLVSMSAVLLLAIRRR